MADLAATSPLALRPGPHGTPGQAGVTLQEHWLAAAASVAGDAGDLSLPSPGRWIDVPGGRVLWVGAGRFLALGLSAAMLRVRADSAAIADQADGRVFLELTGPRVRDALAKGVTLDLHPAVFADGAVAATVAAHVPTLIWRDGGSIWLSVPRSYAADFAEWLLSATAEFGVSVREPV